MHIKNLEKLKLLRFVLQKKNFPKNAFSHKTTTTLIYLFSDTLRHKISREAPNCRDGNTA